MQKIIAVVCMLICPWKITKPNPTTEVIEQCDSELCRIERQMLARLHRMEH